MVYSANSDFPVLREGTSLPVLNDLSAEGPLPETGYVLVKEREHRALGRLQALEVQLGSRLLVPECWSLLLPRAGVLIRSHISGGTLEQRFREAAHAYAGRCWLDASPVCHFLPLPCPDGQAIPITLPALSHSFYSAEFRCRYACSQSPPGLYLFDTEQTQQEKQDLARSCGFRGAVLSAKLPRA